MILKVAIWQPMDRETGIRIPHPLPWKNLESGDACVAQNRESVTKYVKELPDFLF